jgi:hypothetical protein
MVLKATVEVWKEGLSPDDTIRAWATAASTSVILAVLIEERIATDGAIKLDLDTQEEGPGD